MKCLVGLSHVIDVANKLANVHWFSRCGCDY